MRRMEYVPLSFDVPASTGVKVYENKPLLGGTIRTVDIHWPDGCNHLVGVAVYHGSVQFLPRSGYLALNDANPLFGENTPLGINEPKPDEEELWADIVNGDGANPHSITVSVGVEVEN